jgi:hypothetical protein
MVPALHALALVAVAPALPACHGLADVLEALQILLLWC